MASNYCAIHSQTMDWRLSKTKFDNDGQPKGYFAHEADDKLCFGRPEKPSNGNFNSPKKFNQSMQDDNGRSNAIQRQHSQDMAIEFVRLLVQTGQLTSVSTELITKYTDHFQRDIENGD